MPELDPAMAAILEEMRRQDLPPLDTLPSAQARAESERRNAYWNEPKAPLARVEEVAAPGPRGPVRVRLYAGERAAASGRAPCVLYVHGGGWVICSLDTHDVVCRGLALAGDHVVASVDYGLAPSTRSRTGSATAWPPCAGSGRRARRSGSTPPGSPSPGTPRAPTSPSRCASPFARPASRSRVRRASSTASTPTTTKARPTPRSAAATSSSRPRDALVLGPLRPRPRPRRDPLASPLHADLRGLPPLYVSAAELDPLRDDSERLARRLVDAGADFDYRLWRGVTHASFIMGRAPRGGPLRRRGGRVPGPASR